jgi:hypothetical protein
VAGVDAGKIQHVTKEGAVSFRIPTVDNNMSAVDHWKLRFNLPMPTALYGCK